MIPFVPNDTSLVGRYYILDHDDYTDVIVGPEPEVPGMRGAVLAGMANPIIEPVMLKLHGPPFEQVIRDGEDPETGEPFMKKVFLVVVIDRYENLYLVHWNSTGCFLDWNEALRYREEHFDRLKRKQLLVWGGASSVEGKRYIQELADFEDKKFKELQLAKIKKVADKAKVVPVNTEEIKRLTDFLSEQAASISGVPKTSLFKPGK